MSLPKLGIYTSSKEIRIEITETKSSNGEITGTYQSKDSPKGVVSYSGKIGNFSWVKNGAGEAGTAPFNIRFVIVKRPEDWSYCMYDVWNGIYQQDHTMRLTGSRSFVNDQGETECVSLGTKEFLRKEEF